MKNLHVNLIEPARTYVRKQLRLVADVELSAHCTHAYTDTDSGLPMALVSLPRIAVNNTLRVLSGSATVDPPL